MACGLLPVNQLIMWATAMRIFQRCIAQEFQGNVIINSRYCPGLGLEKSVKKARTKMRVLIIALALGYCPSLLLFCLGPNFCLCPDYCLGMLLRLCPFLRPGLVHLQLPSAINLALNYRPCRVYYPSSLTVASFPNRINTSNEQQ